MITLSCLQILLKCKRDTRCGVRCRAQMRCVLHESTTPYLYYLVVGLGGSKIGNHLKPFMHVAMQPLERGEVERAPWASPFAITLLWWAPGWAGVAPTSVLDPGLACWWAFSFYSIAHFCFTLSELRLLSCFPLVFKYMSCKT